MRMIVASTYINYITFLVRIIEKAYSRRLSFLKYDYMYRQELGKGPVLGMYRPSKISKNGIVQEHPMRI